MWRYQPSVLAQVRTATVRFWSVTMRLECTMAHFRHLYGQYEKLGDKLIAAARAYMDEVRSGQFPERTTGSE